MKTMRLIINSKGSCFLCSKQIAKEPGPPNAQSIQNLTEYLELDIGTVLTKGKASIPPWLLKKMKRATLEVELCGICLELNEQFLGIVRQLEMNKVDMESCLKLIQCKLSNTRKDDATDHDDMQGYDVKFVSSIGTRFKGQLGILGNLRWETLQKCLQKLNIGSPTVKLQKLKVDEVSKITLKLKPNFFNSPDSDPETDYDSDCVILSDYDVNAPENDDDECSEDDSTDNSKEGPSQEDSGCVSGGSKDSSSDDDQDNKTENKLLGDSADPQPSTSIPSTLKGEFKTIYVNQRGNQRNPTHILGGGRKYYDPIIIYRSQIKAAKYGPKSFKKCIFNPQTSKYKCRLCPKEFIGATQAVNHFKSIHLEIQYKCPLAKCGKLFSYQRSFDRHVEFEHQGKRYECPYCKARVHQGLLYLHRKKYDSLGICPKMQTKYRQPKQK